MFSFMKKKLETAPESAPQTSAESPVVAEESGGLFARLRQSLSKTRTALADSLSSLILGRKTIDQALLDDIETQLLTADMVIIVLSTAVAVGVTGAAAQTVSTGRGTAGVMVQKLDRKQLGSPEALLESLKEELTALLTPCEVPLEIPVTEGPYVILVVGVNGAGKTTTIGKLARRLQNDGKKLVLEAGDTFRAAAVEQLKVWGERHQIPVIAQPTGSDSASVIFDAYQSAKARGADVLIADTAGRLHTKDNLMQELEKIARVLKKLDPALPHETLLVLDATTGQNSLNQARSFHKSVNVTGIALTKLDGTAKGGMVFAIAKELVLPIRFIGVGEKAEDLRPFEAREFVDALFTNP